MSDAINAEYIIRTNYLGVFKYIILPINELSVHRFCEKVFTAFKIATRRKVGVVLYDNFGTHIPEYKFDTIIKAFWQSGSFFVRFEYAVTQDDVFIPSAMELKKFLLENNAENLFIENQRAGNLGVTSQKKLMEHVANFVCVNFGMYPETSVKNEVALSCIQLFAYLKDDSKEGLELLVNKRNTGYIDTRLRALRRIKGAKKPKKAEGNRADGRKKRASSGIFNVTPVNADLMDIDHDGLMKEVKDLKMIVVNKDTLLLIEEKLNKTREFRANLLSRPEIEIKEYFPYFFTHPELILKEFTLKYNDKNPNTLLEKWPKYQIRMADLLSNQYRTYQIITMWPDDINEVLVFLRIFPSKPTRRDNATNESFQGSVAKLITHCSLHDHPEDINIPSKSFPYIVARGADYKDIIQYFIVVECKAFLVPEGFDFIQTFDLFFKVHKIFDLKFEPNLRGLMTYFQHFIYGIRDENIKPTNRMFDLFNRIENAI